MTTTRRKALFLAATVVLMPPVLLAQPRNYLWGTWVVRCAKGHDDTVTDGTAQHKCEKCGAQVFRNGKVTVVCLNGHPNEVTLHERTESVICNVADCKKECRRKK